MYSVEQNVLICYTSAKYALWKKCHQKFGKKKNTVHE